MANRSVNLDSPVIGINDMELKRKLARLATLDDRTVSHIAKRLLAPAVADEEARLNLPSIEEDPAYQAAS